MRAFEREMATSAEQWSNWTTNQICSAIEDERERAFELLTELLVRGELNVLRIEMIEVVGGMLARVDEVLANVDEVLATVKTSNRQMFADLQAQTDAGFARLQSRIDAPFQTERKDDEPPKLN